MLAGLFIQQGRAHKARLLFDSSQWPRKTNYFLVLILCYSMLSLKFFILVSGIYNTIPLQYIYYLYNISIIFTILYIIIGLYAYNFLTPYPPPEYLFSSRIISKHPPLFKLIRAVTHHVASIL